MEEVIKFIPKELAILVAGLYVIGAILKFTPKIQNWTIPWILMLLGIGFSISIMGINPTSILQGIICSFSAVATNQLIKQTKNKEERGEDDDKDNLKINN